VFESRNAATAYCGADSCPAGLVLASLREPAPPPAGSRDAPVAKRLELSLELIAVSELADRTFEALFVDLPIGIPGAESGDRSERACDRIARRMLGRRASTVFSVPIREAVSADSYESACRVQEGHTGRRISKQSWNILPKVRELDELLRERPGVARRAYEAHPELSFFALNACTPVSEPKKRAGGASTRLRLLRQAAGELDPTLDVEATMQRFLSETARRLCAPDDVLDAICLAICACLSAPSKLGRLDLPESPELDPFGLPMRMALPKLSCLASSPRLGLHE
jgi:predicted RNase H-like nuclease